jgi:magnesium transporter
MTNDVVTLTSDLSIREARSILHERLRQADFAHFIYVVDKAGQVLQGTAKLRDLVIAKDEQRLEEIVNPYVTALDPLESANLGAYRVINSHIAALPVIGREKQLLGIVTVDAAVMRVAPSSWSSQAPKVFS